MATITGGGIMIEALRRNGVDTLFDIPGDPMGAVLGAARTSGMPVYSFRHEQATAMAAQAYGFVSGKIGVGVVASGPAMTNAVTGLATAWANCWPMLLIGGSSELGKRGLGDFQEMPQVESAAPFCKWSVAIDEPRRIPWFVNTAIRKMLGGRPSPVYLDFPADVINARVEDTDVQWLPPEPRPARLGAEPEAVRHAARELLAAERPLVLIGKGAASSDAGDEARELVELLDIPFVPSPMGKGVLPDEHPLCFAGARSYALRESDVVLLVGARFNWIFHFGLPPRFAPAVKVVQVDIDADEIGNNVPATVGLVGDAKAVLRQLVDEIGSTSGRSSETPWVKSLREERQRNADAIDPMVSSEEPFTNLYRMFREINAVTTPETILVNDGESTMAVSRVMETLDRPRRRLDAGVSGCMGVGVPYAIGAQIADPGSRVLSINGDYAFGWNGMELETAVRHQLPIVFVVANNGSIRPGAAAFDMRGFTAEQAVRYDLMMAAFGGHAENVNTSGELRPALERALASGRTALVNVAIDPLARRKAQQFGWLDRTSRVSYGP